MNDEQINKAFNGRWRVYGHGNDDVKRLCFDFFRAGCLISSVDGCTTTISPAGFEDFWNAYQKKVGRPKCEKLWSKLSSKEKADCMAYIPLYIESQPDKQYRKNPETFLRNKSWNDEIISRYSTPTQQQLRESRISAAARLVAEYGSED